MPTELEELVGFISHVNPQIRLLAVENLVPYSLEQPSIFKANDSLPVKHLKVLILDHPKIAEHAITILINLSDDSGILQNLVADDKFIERVFENIVSPDEPNADLLAMLLANLAKHDELLQIVLARRQKAPAALGSDDRVLNQLLDLFVKGADKAYNKHADYDYLAYVFADLSKHAEARQFFVTAQDYEGDGGVVPLTKIRVFTEHASDVRRRGVASTLKNVAFDVAAHPSLLAEDEIHVLPYLLLPLAGGESTAFDADSEEMLDMLPDLQLLPADKKRDPDPTILQTHVETLTLLTTTRAGRELMRRVQVYPLIRETHLHVEDEGVREACDRLVQVLMRDEAEDEGAEDDDTKHKAIEELDDDEDERIVQV